MKLVTCILMFIRASREGDWSLHLEYLKALARYFFAYGGLRWCHYIYLVQMHRFKIDDPGVYLEFRERNFCITKKESPFCAIGPDHAIEHVNKLMKVRGGHNNQQPWQDGSLWHQN